MLIASGDFVIGQVTLINLNRPSRKNAFGRVMLTQLEEVVHELVHTKTTRVVILNSLVERCFSAGADLKERAEMPADEVAGFVGRLQSTFSRVEELAVPTIAALDGVALGGGLELALCCDLRYAGATAKLGLPETKLAILPAAGGSQRLARLIGISKAKELVFTGTILGPAEAHHYGVVNAVAPAPTTALQHALRIAQTISENGPLAVRYAKEAINRGAGVDLTTGLSIEKLCYAQLIPTEDRREGLLAFKEGRPPHYQGK